VSGGVQEGSESDRDRGFARGRRRVGKPIHSDSVTVRYDQFIPMHEAFLPFAAAKFMRRNVAESSTEFHRPNLIRSSTLEPRFFSLAIFSREMINVFAYKPFCPSLSDDTSPRRQGSLSETTLPSISNARTTHATCSLGKTRKYLCYRKAATTL
jgi:hypothetical protein